MLDMGEPVRIVDLARQMIRLSGLREGLDARIEFTGLRPGEKLHEELAGQDERAAPTAVEKVWLVQPSANGEGPDVLRRAQSAVEAEARRMGIGELEEVLVPVEGAVRR